MGMPQLLLFRVEGFIDVLRDHVLHPDEAGVLGSGIIYQTLAHIWLAKNKPINRLASYEPSGYALRTVSLRSSYLC
jgi:hypothetical protein